MIERIKFRGKLSRDMNNFDASCEVTQAGSWMYCSGASDSEAWAKMSTAERYQHLSIPRFFELVDARTIDPSTVSQWTGLKDSKGVEVYEGDIIACKEDSGNIVTGEVVFGKQNGAWCAYFPQFGTGIRSPLLNFISGTMCAAASSEFEVISNIHDKEQA